MIDLGDLREHIRALQSDDDHSRQQAMHALNEYDEKEWRSVSASLTQSLVEQLNQQLLDGKRVAVRQESLKVLTNIGPAAADALDGIKELLKDRIPDSVREEAIALLGKIGKPAVAAAPDIVHVLSYSRTPLAMHAIDTLETIGKSDKKIQAVLLAAWRDQDVPVLGKMHLAVAMSRLRVDVNGLSSLLTRTLVTHQEANFRRLAAEALAFSNKQVVDVVPALILAAVHDKDEGIREVAEAGLTQLGLTKEKAIKFCAKQLEESLHAETALRHCGELAIPALVEAVGASDPGVSEKAIRLLSLLAEQAQVAVPAITKSLNDKDIYVRLAAAKGLWNITKEPTHAVPALIKLLDEKAFSSPDGEDRRRFMQTVIEALGRIGPEAQDAVPALTKKSKDKNRHVAASAAFALKSISAPVAK